MASVITTRAEKKTKPFIVFINSCHGHEPTHDVKEEAGGRLEWTDQWSHADQTEETRTWRHFSLSGRHNVSTFGSYQKKTMGSQLTKIFTS